MLRQSDRRHHIRYHILCVVGSACRGIEEVVPIIMSKFVIKKERSLPCYYL